MAHSETYRAASSAYVVFGVICGIPGLLGVAAALMSPMSWAPALIPVGAYAVVCVWLSQFRLTFLEDRISYQSLFATERAIPYKSIESVSPAFSTRAFESPLTVSVKTKSGEELRINTKVFPRHAVQRLMAVKS